MPAFQTHTVRFFIPEPRAVQCLALNGDEEKLAVSRSDNSIELWHVRSALSGCGAPVCQARLPAAAGASVEALAWCGGLLFSTGLHGHVLQHDDSLLATGSTAVTGGAAWCMAAEPGRRRLAVGTEDGHLVILALGDEGLLFDKRLTKQEKRIMSVAWHPEGRYLAAGSVNAVCLHDAQTAGMLSRIAVGRKTGSQETLVWSVALLSDLTVVTGDSRGRVSFWNGRLGALHSSLNSHKADVLAVAVAETGDTVFAAGVDPAIVRIERVKTKRQERHAWVRSARVELHVRDVRALVATGRWLISAGVDAALVFDVVGSNKETIRTSPLPQLGTVLPAPSLPGLVTTSDSSVQLWQLPAAAAAPPSQLLQLQCRRGEPLVCAAVSPAAAWLAYSTPARLRLHRVEVTSGRPSLQRVRCVPAAADTAAAQLCFTPAGDALVMLTADGRLVRLLLAAEDDRLAAEDLGPADGRAGDDNDEEEEVASVGVLGLLTVSSDGSRAALADRDGGVIVWDMAERVIPCQLPRHTAPATALVFRPDSPHLVVVYADRAVAEYDSDSGRATAWSRWAAGPAGVPVSWRRRRLPVRHASFSGCGRRLLLHDDTGVCALDATAGQSEPATEKKRARTTKAKVATEVEVTGAADSSVVITDKYRHLLYLGSFGEDQLLAVEAPAALIEEKLPPALRRKRFGVA